MSTTEEQVTAHQATERIVLQLPHLLHAARVASSVGQAALIDRQCQLLIEILEDVQIHARQRMREL